MCRVLGVSPSGFYAWSKRDLSARAIRDVELSARIRMYHARSKGRYGAPNIHADLRDEGIRVGKKRVARLMKAEGLQGACYRKWVTTTTRDADGQASADLVQRQFNAEAPDRLWVADITYVPTWAGFLLAIFEFIEGWYNPIRRHTGLGRISPIEFERRHAINPEHAVTHRPARSVAREAPCAQPVDNRL
jgi:transposase InsO family protein